MAGVIFNVAVFVAVLYFYSVGNLATAIAVAVFLLYRVFQTRLARIASIVAQLDNVPAEIACNTVLVCRYSVEKALSHPSVDALFQRLRSTGKVQAATVSEWRELLVDNYKRKYKRAEPFEEVRFNVKNNLLFKNGEPDFNDTIYHPIKIPYQFTEGVEAQRPMLTPSIEVQLEIRLLLVNGVLVLQLGDFDKKSTPQMLRDGSLAVYQTYVTLTSFPFLYFSSRHGLPTRYLNLSYHATESYKDHWHSLDRKEAKRFWKRRTGMFDDWKRLHRELAVYRVLCDGDNPNYSYSQVTKLSQDFEAKRNKLLNGEHFTTWHKKTEDDWRYGPCQRL